jgi:hypothetical protein
MEAAYRMIDNTALKNNEFARNKERYLFEPTGTWQAPNFPAFASDPDLSSDPATLDGWLR